ncbi:aldehyde dehydrogenase (NAD+) [Marininema mesophilum]|uniref:Aldehyde dehydrogenase n=1 Tax=Marininema mesophilum TaxID=1048340 RepID=A0A1H2YG51_9BACL|nr:aldehyde dehydrogenase [Marininema mesophilum]SDX03529.1 aldehyde dehydrogenase (NAD+) [Marininema mesophilum]
MKSIDTLVNEQKTFFHSGNTRPIDFRREQLAHLREWIRTHEAHVMEALKKDLNKSTHEAYATEVGISLKEIRTAIRNVSHWSRPQRVPTSMIHFGAKSWIQPEPYGTALIIGPWNYPFQLIIAPLVAAITAGNCVVIKPSELAPHTSTLIRGMVEELFEPAFVTVIEGDVQTSTELLAQPFDTIFFTGSVPVGKIVMEAAAKNLTPITLELGGKSPVIVDRDANIPLAAKRIAWGKITNAGQTCIAPDYLLVHREVEKPLIQGIQAAIKENFGEHPLNHPDYPHIINRRHFDRLSLLLGKGEIIAGGAMNSELPAIEPTLVSGASWNDPIMEDEIFGPILPIIPFDDLDDVIEKIRSKPKPLALYYFTNSKKNEQKILQSLPFGGGCINDTLMHFASPYLPFGGVGPSGMGSYHGKSGFDAFSHHKSILKQTTRFDFPFRYHSSKVGLSVLRKLLR